MSQNFSRASMLMGQGRWEMAVAELRQHLASQPNDPIAHAMAGLCLAEMKQFGDASDHCAEAIRLAPDLAYAHYTAGHVFAQRNRFKEALAAANEAVRLDPEDADNYGLLAMVHLNESRHQQALEAAENGLRVDPSHVQCQNFRAMALKNLGRHEEAATSLDAAFARDPENAWTHANKGWALLEKNKPEEALKHFQEALRIDPELDWAREGIVVALKARYPFYGFFLKYFLWMSKLSGRQQWMVIIGVYFAQNMLASMSRNTPQWNHIIYPLRGILVAAAVLTWIADPLFNLFLRMNRYGRLALNRDQTKGANLVGSVLGLAVALAVGAFVVRETGGLFLLGAAAMALLSIPASAVYKIPEGGRRNVMAGFCAVLFLTFAYALVTAALTFERRGERIFFHASVPLAVSMLMLGIFASGFLGNILMMWRPKR